MISAEEIARIGDRACSCVSADRLAELVAMVVDAPSPTGEEGVLARRIVKHLTHIGVEAQEQVIQGQQSNAVGHLGGKGKGSSLLLYSPIDTVTSNSDSEDIPWAGEVVRPDMRARSWREGDTVFGLGAQNPKGHAACILMAAEALAVSGAALPGSLRLGFGAGGMPTDSRPGLPSNTGHGVGCNHLLLADPLPDFAIIAKSGWSVSWEEVGLAWYEVTVRGTPTYVGSRHLLPYVNAINQAGKVAQALEDWFPIWANQNSSGLVSPQGVVSYISAGAERTAAFTPAVCRLRFDLRISPRTSVAESDQAVSAFLSSLSARDGIGLSWRRLVAIPGTTTDFDNWLVQSSIRLWEKQEGRAHHNVQGMSGATDANILRAHRVPTVRIGLPKVQIRPLDFHLGMNAVSLTDMERLTQFLIRSAIVTCNERREYAHG